MRSERPVTREEFESVASGVREVVASNQVEASLPFADTRLLVERTEAGGLTLSSVASVVRMPLFVDPVARPDTYPPELPFAPGEVVTIEEAEGRRTAMWWGPEVPSRLFQELHEQTVGDGWFLMDDQEFPRQSSARRAYTKGGARRFILMSSGAVTVIDRQGSLDLAEGGACGP